MSLEIGLVCGRCDAYATLGTAKCVRCGQNLGLNEPIQALTPDDAAAADANLGSAFEQALIGKPAKGSEKTVGAATERRMPVGTPRLDDSPPPSERRQFARPQAPDPLRAISSSAPRVEFFERPKDQSESWGHQTTGKIPVERDRRDGARTTPHTGHSQGAGPATTRTAEPPPQEVRSAAVLEDSRRIGERGARVTNQPGVREPGAIRDIASLESVRDSVREALRDQSPRGFVPVVRGPDVSKNTPGGRERVSDPKSPQMPHPQGGRENRPTADNRPDRRADKGASPPIDRGSGARVNKVSFARAKEELMDQARNFVCRSCQTPVPSGHKFCGRCGAGVPPDVLALREEYYGPHQVPGRAKLTLIRAEGDPGMEGLSYALHLAEHVVGRQGHLMFPEDRFVSPRHANLYYRDGVLVVRDDSGPNGNGVYVRIRGTVELQPGDLFVAGEQVFRLDATPRATDHPDADGTYFWSSPKRPSPFRVVQILQGGAAGNAICAKEAGIGIGREGGDVNFPTDVYMSANHCRVDVDPGGTKLSLTDLNSRNGTYLRIRGERDLAHGDYVFIGRKILRVEIAS